MFRLTLCIAAAAAAVSQASFAAEPVVVLEPSSAWHLDYAEQSCRLGRTFGDAENISAAFFTQHGPSGSFEMTLAGEPLQRFSSNRDVVTQFGPIGGEREIRLFKGDVDGVGPALIYSGVSLEEKPDETEDDAEDDTPEVMTSLPAIDIERAQGMDYIEVSQRNRRVRFATGPLDKAFAALNACSEDLLAAWGLDVEQHRSLTRMVVLTNGGEIASRIQQDYPVKALRKGEQGIIRTLLLVDEKGEVNECKLASATDSETLSGQACRALEDAIFEPALDSRGQPMRSFYVTKIIYVLG